MSERKPHITEPAIPDPTGVHSTPPVFGIGAQSVVLLGEAAIVIVQPHTVFVTGPDGENGGDVIETSVRANGGVPLVLPPDFGVAPASGWEADLDTGTDMMRIWFPGGTILYDGQMPTGPQWTQAFAASVRSRGKSGTRGSVVLVTGPIRATVDIEPTIIAGRATWIRIPLLLR